MPSDLTTAKSELWMRAADPLTILPCPSCDGAMVASETILRWAVGTGRVKWNGVEVAEASHVEAAADGGTRVALECARCNHSRGRAPWNVTPNTDTVRVGKRRAGVEARAAIRAAEVRLT